MMRYLAKPNNHIDLILIDDKSENKTKLKVTVKPLDLIAVNQASEFNKNKKIVNYKLLTLLNYTVYSPYRNSLIEV